MLRNMAKGQMIFLFFIWHWSKKEEFTSNYLTSELYRKTLYHVSFSFIYLFVFYFGALLPFVNIWQIKDIEIKICFFFPTFSALLAHRPLVCRWKQDIFLPLQFLPHGLHPAAWLLFIFVSCSTPGLGAVECIFIFLEKKSYIKHSKTNE